MKQILKDTKWFRWNPNKDLAAVSVSYILVVAALSSATFLATSGNGGLYFILYAIVCAAVFGIGFPVVWTVFVGKKSLGALGITKKNLKLSILIQIVLSVILYTSAYKNTQLPEFSYLAPLMALVLTIGFFEAVFWRGWVLLRLEESFGLLPAIILGSVLYSLYHIGYGMPITEMVFLFFVGVMFAIIFRITKSIFILWPVFQPMGQMINLLKDRLPLPMIAVLGFLEVLVGMFAIGIISMKIAGKKKYIFTS